MTAPREQESDPRPVDKSPEEEPVTADQDPGAEKTAEETGESGEPGEPEEPPGRNPALFTGVPRQFRKGLAIDGR